MDLTNYQVILVNTSAGKDSLVMLDLVCTLASSQGVLDRVRAVHCDLGRMEWSGTRKLAEQQCALYGVPLHVVSRAQDLLSQVEQRGMWPSSTARYCTSDHKRDQVGKYITALVNAHICDTYGKAHKAPVTVLNCLGLRAQESSARKAKLPVAPNKRATNSKRTVTDWLPIHAWTENQVWSVIHSKSLPYHRAYDLGMPRLSCVFCIFAPKPALLLAGYHNRELLAEYVAVEQRINHTFKTDLALIQIQDTLNAGYVPTSKIDSALWKECA